jgi:hypothetical protein
VGCHGGGGDPSRPPWTGGRSGQRSSRREREAPWELGRLRRGRCEELEGRGVCLGGCCGWCGSFQENRGPFYRRERAGVEVADGGGPAACNGHCRARRLWERAGEVRSRHLGTAGVLWRAHAGRHRAERQRERRGVRSFSSLSLGSLGWGLGRGVVESTEGNSTSTATRLGRTGMASAIVV